MCARRFDAFDDDAWEMPADSTLAAHCNDPGFRHVPSAVG